VSLDGCRVLLVGAGRPEGLVAARSLGRAGANVHLSAAAPTANRWSRYVSAWSLHPEPQRDGAAFGTWLAETAARGGFDVVMPIDDRVTAAIAIRNLADQLPETTVMAAPRADDIVVSMDKLAMADVCRSASVSAPAGRAVDRPEEAAAMAEELGRVVVKSRWASRIDEAGVVVEGGRVHRCSSPAEALDAARRIIDAEGTALVQSMVDGDEYGVGAVRDREGSVSAVVQRRIRSWPPTGGPPSLVRSVEAPPSVLRAMTGVLAAFDWIGCAQADIILADGRGTRDRDGDGGKNGDGDGVMLDLNARMWFSVGLGPRCGVDFPVLTVAVALGERIPSSSTYPVDSGWAHADTELRYALCLAANRRGLRRPGESGFAALRRWRQELHRPIQIDPFDGDDYRPALGRLLVELPKSVASHWRERRAVGTP
jgi:predicted ATP-grasp superfamily ATP-dependent carboligase